MAIHDDYYTAEFRPVVSFDREPEADIQVAFIERAIPLEQGHRILDLACGFGRHSIALAKRGYCVTGYDRSADYIAWARRAAADVGVQVTFDVLDMRALDVDEAFDVVLSMSTSLAFYSDEVNADIFCRAGQALKPGGRFLFDQANIFRLVTMFGGDKHDGSANLPDGRVHRFTTTFDAATCVLSRRSVLESDTERKEAGWDLRYYTHPELQAIMRDVDLQLAGTWGDYDGSPYVTESMRHITVWQKV